MYFHTGHAIYHNDFYKENTQSRRMCESQCFHDLFRTSFGSKQEGCNNVYPDYMIKFSDFPVQTTPLPPSSQQEKYGNNIHILIRKERHNHKPEKLQTNEITKKQATSCASHHKQATLNSDQVHAQLFPKLFKSSAPPHKHISIQDMISKISSVWCLQIFNQSAASICLWFLFCIPPVLSCKTQKGLEFFSHYMSTTITDITHQWFINSILWVDWYLKWPEGSQTETVWGLYSLTVQQVVWI